jgi:hypothetical protein
MLNMVGIPEKPVLTSRPLNPDFLEGDGKGMSTLNAADLPSGHRVRFLQGT